MFESNEIFCYRQFLDLNQQFQELLLNRDKTLRSCIQRFFLELVFILYFLLAYKFSICKILLF